MDFDLMDWKGMERGALEQINTGRTMIVVGETVLAKAVKEIKALGGLTVEEEDEIARKEQKKALKSSTG